MDIYGKIRSRWDTIAKPLDGLGVLEDLICRIGAVQETVTPDISRRCVLIMCADNGIVEEGISQTSQDVTYTVASWMGRNESSVCHLAQVARADVIPVDIGICSPNTPEGVLDRKVVQGTRNFLKEPAMTSEECHQAIDTGIALVRKCRESGYTIAASGEMGIGNTTTASALAEIFLGDGSGSLVGRGAGLDDSKLKNKRQVVKKAYELYSALEPFDVLRSIGGADIAGLAGIFIGGARYNMPVIIDGAISAMAAVCAELIEPGAKKCMIPSHIGKERTVEAALKFLGLDELAMIHGRLALGEGTGAVMMFPLLDMALDYYLHALRFEETAVEQYERFSK